MTATRQDYRPSHAGNVLLKECQAMRATLLAKLPKPAKGNDTAMEAHIIGKVAIKRMDHKELRAALAR